MRHLLVILVICTAASQAAADCQAPQETVNVWGQNLSKGGVAGMFRDDQKNCETSDQPAWIAKMNQDKPTKGVLPAGLVYCRQIAKGKEPQTEAQRRDCVFWYGHSVEVER